MKVFARRGEDFDDAALECAAAIGSLRLAKRVSERLLVGAPEQRAAKASNFATVACDGQASG